MISLKEALVRKNRNNDVQELVYSEVIDFLKQNYKFSLHLGTGERLPDYEKYITLRNSGSKILVDIANPNNHILDVTAEDMPALTNGLFEFGNIDGFFICCKDRAYHQNKKLLSLEGAPKSVIGFSCDSCIKLKSLKGSPRIVEGDFSCEHCDSLTDLVGAPKEVDVFSCRWCKNLSSLKGAPYEVTRVFHCDECPKRTSLEGISKIIDGDLYVGRNPNIRTLKGLSYVDGDIYIEKDSSRPDDAYGKFKDQIIEF